MTTIPMCASVVVLKDHVRTKVSTIVYTGQQKEERLRRFHEADPLLKKLQKQPTFEGRKCFFDLDPYHFRVLIALHMSLIDDLPLHHRNDPANATVRSLDFLMVGFVICLEMRTQGQVDMLTIDRMSDTKLVYKLSASLEEMAFPQPRPSKLRVIVDNG